MTIEIEDLQNVEAWEPKGELIGKGKHLAEIAEAAEEPASTGSPQVVLTWRSVKTGASRKEWLVVLPQTYGKVKAFLAAVGWQMPPGKFTMPVRELVGRKAVITIADEVYNNSTSLRVIAHEPADTKVPDVPIATAGLPEPDSAPLPF